MQQQTIETLRQALQESALPFAQQEPLASHTTFQIGGPAVFWCTPKTVDQLRRTLALCRENGVRTYLLGNGSNTLFADEGYDGAVIDLRGLNFGPTAEPRPDGSTRLTAGAGLTLGRLCAVAQQQSLAGIAFACGIPGTIGGAVYMNAGAYGGEMKDVLESVTFLDSDLTERTLPAAELALGYRTSLFEQHPDWCVLSATVRLQPGDSAASVEERYGALAYIEQDVLYRAECTTTGGDSDNENKMIHVGEKVYIRSTANNERVGEARVIGVEGKSYTLEVTSQTDMRLNENIKVYRSANHANSSCIGTGKLSRIDPQGVTATGYVLAAYVEDGQHISRGDVLFDVVPDVLDGMVGGDGHVYMPEDGVLLSVSAVSGEQAAKDAVLATYCPKDAMRLVCSVDEQDLSELAVGDVMQVTLDAYEDKPLRGTIAKIASASGDDGTSTSFDVTIELEANDLMRIGMSASAER